MQPGKFEQAVECGEPGRGEKPERGEIFAAAIHLII